MTAASRGSVPKGEYTMTAQAHGLHLFSTGARWRVGAGALAAGLALLCATVPAAAAAKKASHYAAGAMPEKARTYYAMNWGVDQMSAKLTESGALVRFTYRVVDAKLAQVMQDKASAPTLIDDVAHVSLVIPTLEKVGPLRQAMAVENGNPIGWRSRTRAVSSSTGIVSAS